MPTACGADLIANDLLTSLAAGADFTIPVVDTSTPGYNIPVSTLPAPTTLGNVDLTTGIVGGTGTFDIVMKSTAAHIKAEFEAGRITGAEYTKSYIALTAAALNGSIQFLLGRDQAYWSAVTAQLQAKVAEAQVVIAKVSLETAKIQLKVASIDGHNKKAEYALTKMKLATEEIQFCASKYSLDNILPVQKRMLEEQAETARAQTLDTRSDGITAVVGSVGKQKALYQQQIDSYKRDAEVKAAKLFTDAWITQKTIDEGLLAPTEFANASLNVILGKLKTNNGLL